MAKIGPAILGDYRISEIEVVLVKQKVSTCLRILLKFFTALVVSVFVSAMAYYQVKHWILPKEFVTQVLHFKFNRHACHDTASTSTSRPPRLRECSFLQANFSVIDRDSRTEFLHAGVEYKIELVLELPDYHINYEVSLLFTLK